jgi:hypothetical protein
MFYYQVKKKMDTQPSSLLPSTTETSLDMFLTMMSTPDVPTSNIQPKPHTDGNDDDEDNMMKTNHNNSNKEFCIYCGIEFNTNIKEKNGEKCNSCHRYWVRPPPPLLEENLHLPTNNLLNEQDHNNDHQVEEDEGWNDTRNEDEALEDATARDYSERQRIRDALFEPPSHNDIIYGYVERYRGPDIVSFHLFDAADDSFVLAATMKHGGSVNIEMISLHTRRDIKGAGKFSDINIPKRIIDDGFCGALLPQSVLGTEFIVCNSPEFSFAKKDQITTSNNSTSSSTSGMNPIKSPIQVNNLKSQKSKTSSTTTNNKNTYDNDNDDDEFDYDHHIDDFSTTKMKQHLQQQNHRDGLDFALINYSPNVMGTSPNSFKLTVRCNPQSFNITKSIRQRLKEVSATRYDTDATLWERVSNQKAIYTALSSTEDADEIASFETKKAEWNPDLGGFVLDFNGRVSVSSKKNCILVPVDERAFGYDTTCFRFGKVTKHRFALDYRWPLSPAVALATAVTLFANKLAVL